MDFFTSGTTHISYYFLLKLNLDYSVEVIFGNQHVNIENFESTNFEELYVKKDGDSNFLFIHLWNYW